MFIKKNCELITELRTNFVIIRFSDVATYHNYEIGSQNGASCVAVCSFIKFKNHLYTTEARTNYGIIQS